MITISQVTLWGIHRGIAHAVQSRKGDYSITACGTWGNTMERFVTELPSPARVCRRCREALKNATLVGPENGTGETP